MAATEAFRRSVARGESISEKISVQTYIPISEVTDMGVNGNEVTQGRISM